MAMKVDAQRYKNIDSLHQDVHGKYIEIYEIYFGSAENVVYDQKAIIEKRNVSPDEEAQARKSFEELRSISYKLLDEIAALEKRVEVSETF